MTKPILVPVLYTLYDGVRYFGSQIDGVAWRCGKCGRGVLLESRKRCRVCRNRVIVEHRPLNPIPRKRNGLTVFEIEYV